MILFGARLTEETMSYSLWNKIRTFIISNTLPLTGVLYLEFKLSLVILINCVVESKDNKYECRVIDYIRRL
jgi:hypothetical protein